MPELNASAVDDLKFLSLLIQQQQLGLCPYLEPFTTGFLFDPDKKIKRSLYAFYLPTKNKSAGLIPALL
jgi:hypothetical protein